MRHRFAFISLVSPTLAVVLTACSGPGGGSESSSGITGTDTQATTSASTSPTTTDSGDTQGTSNSASGTSTAGTVTSASASGTSASSTGGASGPLFDVGMGTTGVGTTGEPPNLCKVGPDGQGGGPCRAVAPADSFEPELQWGWDGDGAYNSSIVTPLVANLTDDNNDGEIDLCDIPDVVVVVNTGSCSAARIYVLDGATGAQHFMIDAGVARASTPAIGDIDNDGLPEIVVQAGATSCNGADIAVYEHDGTLKWQNSFGIGGENAIALADLDNDGDVEILIEHYVIDHLGNLVFSAGDTGDLNWTAIAASDLDGDGDQEVVLGRSAWHHDGTQYYWNMAANPGQPTIADLDGDALPEVLVIESGGFAIYENDGVLKVPSMNPTGDTDWRRPAAIHDVDGDDMPEFLVSSRNTYSSFNGDASQNWAAPVADNSGLASGTAFDFLGDGVAEAIYGDETKLWVFDGQTGTEVFQVPRGSITIIEYPVVVDVDNDGASEIVVVTNHDANSPTVQVYRDAEERWIQARRVWNQHTYHVTNVREDSTIPQFEAPHWLGLNTFRTNAQIEGGSVCEPEG
jgi:hypothetical protein